MYTRPLLHTGRPLVERFAERNVVVIGDVMLDHFLIGHVDRISPEAPVPVVEFARDDYRLGGAANVAHNIRALGGIPILVGLVGADDGAECLRRELAAAGLSAEGLVTDPTRPTTRKMRIVTNRHQQVARVDYEDDREVSGEVEDALMAATERTVAQADVIIVSDYLKGVVTRRLMQAVMAAARARGIAVLVDPKIPHLPYYAGATVITPNHHEAESATHHRIRTEEDARLAAREFRRLARCQSVMITRGEQGHVAARRRTARPGRPPRRRGTRRCDGLRHAGRCGRGCRWRDRCSGRDRCGQCHGRHRGGPRTRRRDDAPPRRDDEPREHEHRAAADRRRPGGE